MLITHVCLDCGVLSGASQTCSIFPTARACDVSHVIVCVHHRDAHSFTAATDSNLQSWQMLPVIFSRETEYGLLANMWPRKTQYEWQNLLTGHIAQWETPTPSIPLANSLTHIEKEWFPDLDYFFVPILAVVGGQRLWSRVNSKC